MRSLLPLPALVAILALCGAGAAGCARGADTSEGASGSGGSSAGGTGGASGAAGISGAAGSTGGASQDAGPDAIPDAPNEAAPDAPIEAAPDAQPDATVGGCQCDSPNCGACPSVAMISVTGFKIDSIEVTNGQYAAFLSANPSVAAQPPACVWNTTFEPSQAWPGADDLPVTTVNWCDAYAYCHWARKHLCGAVGGGPGDFDGFAEADTDQWHRACTGAGARTYPYGNTYESATCNGSDFGAGTKVPGGQASCQGAYPGLFDMSGNVWEWTDACDADTEGATCRIRGGSFANGAPALRCDTDSSAVRSETHPTVGLRCCLN